MLSNPPLKQYQKIGQYYLAWCERKNGDSVTGILENLAETAPAKYRASAMHVLATIAARKQDTATEFYWLTESLRVYPSLESLRGIAIIKTREGFHEFAWLCCINRKAAMLVILVCEEKENQAHLPPSQLETV